MEAVLNVFDQFRMPSINIDEYLEKGKQILSDKIKSFTAKNLPIKFVMLGFPMKSMNTRDKVLGKLPDYGEEIALKNFGAFNEKVKQVYAPGINMQIVSDGYAFADVYGTEDAEIAAYEEMCIELGKQYVNFFDITDFYDKNLSMKTMREKLTEHFGITPENLEQKILFDANVNILYRGMIKFMTGDLAIKDWPSNSQLHKNAKIMARNMMMRNEAYSALVEANFPDSIRLSMHQSLNDGRKYSFQLIPSNRIEHSPWHSVLVESDEGFTTVHKSEGLAAGYEIIYKDGRPYNFKK